MVVDVAVEVAATQILSDTFENGKNVPYLALSANAGPIEIDEGALSFTLNEKGPESIARYFFDPAQNASRIMFTMTNTHGDNSANITLFAGLHVLLELRVRENRFAVVNGKVVMNYTDWRPGEQLEVTLVTDNGMFSVLINGEIFAEQLPTCNNNPLLPDSIRWLARKRSSGATGTSGPTINSILVEDVPSVKLSAPVFVTPAGVVSTSDPIELRSNNGAAIYYTLDGTAPTTDSLLYTAPFSIDRTTVVRMIASKEGNVQSGVVEALYSIGETTGYSNGLAAEFYEFDTIQRTPEEFQQIPAKGYGVYTALDNYHDTFWYPFMPYEDTTEAVLEGYLYVPLDGEYSFNMYQSGTVVISLDDEEVYRRIKHVSSTPNDFSKWLTAGFHKLYVTIGAEEDWAIRLSWSFNGTDADGNPVAFARQSIPAGYFFSTDTDTDAVPDAYEIDLFGDLSTLDADCDYDNDGKSNLFEIFTSRTDPTVSDPLTVPAAVPTLTPGLMRTEYAWTNNRSFPVSLDEVPVLSADVFDVSQVVHAITGHNMVRYSGYIEVPESALYTFRFSSSLSNRIIIDGEQITSNYKSWMDDCSFRHDVYLTAGIHQFSIDVLPNTSSNDVINAVSTFCMDWQSPLIPRSRVAPIFHSADTLAALQEAIDSDADGLTDAQEAVLGTDPNNVDTDADNLSDLFETKNGTDPSKADTDGDGVSDYEEVVILQSNPLVKDISADVIVNDTLFGSEFINQSGEWELKGASVISNDIRGYVEYEFLSRSADKYVLSIDAALEKSGDNSSHILIYVDETYVGALKLNSAETVYDIALPFLKAGNHRLRVFNENVSDNQTLEIRSLKLTSVQGSDNNKNGIKDWIEHSISKQGTLIHVPATSYVSPLFIEGATLYSSLMEVSVDEKSCDLRNGKTGGWYSNVTLKEEDATDITVSYQNGALTRTASTDWTALNLLDSNSPKELVLRKGDSVKLSASVENSVNSTVAIDGAVTNLTGSGVFIHQFSEAGEFLVTAAASTESTPYTSSITVKVIDFCFGKESIPALVGQARSFDIPTLPDGVTLETDDTIQLDLSAVTSTEEHQNPKVTVLASKTNRVHSIIARMPNGQIIDTLFIDTFWLQSAADNKFYLIERNSDYDLIENITIQKNLPEGVYVQAGILVSGALFDDMSLERILTLGSYDNLGIYRLRILKPTELEHSTCHYFKVYDGHPHEDGVLIGQGYSGGNLIQDFNE